MISEELRLFNRFGLLQVIQFMCNTKGVKEKRACNSPRAKTEWAEECYWKSTVISKNRFLLNRVLCKVQVADSYK